MAGQAALQNLSVPAQTLACGPLRRPSPVQNPGPKGGIAAQPERQPANFLRLAHKSETRKYAIRFGQGGGGDQIFVLSEKAVKCKRAFSADRSFALADAGYNPASWAIFRLNSTQC